MSDIRLYREGIGRLLESEARFRVAAANGSLEAVVADWTPDVVLVDAAMADGVAAIRAVRQASPASRVIVLTVSDVDGQLLRFAEAGIAGYVTRDGSQADLVAAIESVERGEAVCSPRAAAALLERVAVLAFRAAAGGRAPHGARERDPRPARGGPVEQGDRRAALHRRADREDPRPQHPQEARRQPPG